MTGPLLIMNYNTLMAYVGLYLIKNKPLLFICYIKIQNELSIPIIKIIKNI